MKGFALVLLCVVAAVQSRSAGVQSVSGERALAALGENPWLVHLRIAVSTSGLLNTCAGSLIGQSWVLTASSCLTNARFIWVRYGVVTVVNPELVTEATLVRLNALLPVGLVNINRVVHSTDNIAPVALATSVAVPESSITFCGFGESESGPGEVLNCYELAFEAGEEEDDLVALSEENKTSRFDLGAPLVSDGVLVGVLVDSGSDDIAGRFVSPSGAISWIEEETGLDLSS